MNWHLESMLVLQFDIRGFVPMDIPGLRYEAVGTCLRYARDTASQLVTMAEDITFLQKSLRRVQRMYYTK